MAAVASDTEGTVQEVYRLKEGSFRNKSGTTHLGIVGGELLLIDKRPDHPSDFMKARFMTIAVVDFKDERMGKHGIDLGTVKKANCENTGDPRRVSLMWSPALSIDVMFESAADREKFIDKFKAVKAAAGEGSGAGAGKRPNDVPMGGQPSKRTRGMSSSSGIFSQAAENFKPSFGGIGAIGGGNNLSSRPTPSALETAFGNASREDRFSSKGPAIGQKPLIRGPVRDAVFLMKGTFAAPNGLEWNIHSSRLGNSVSLLTSASYAQRSAPMPNFGSSSAPSGNSTTKSAGGGLVNLGNTCFFNAVLQCVRAVPRFVEMLRQAKADFDGEVVAVGAGAVGSGSRKGTPSIASSEAPRISSESGSVAALQNVSAADDRAGAASATDEASCAAAGSGDGAIRTGTPPKAGLPGEMGGKEDAAKGEDKSKKVCVKRDVPTPQRERRGSPAKGKEASSSSSSLPQHAVASTKPSAEVVDLSSDSEEAAAEVVCAARTSSGSGAGGAKPAGALSVGGARDSSVSTAVGGARDSSVSSAARHSSGVVSTTAATGSGRLSGTFSSSSSSFSSSSSSPGPDDRWARELFASALAVFDTLGGASQAAANPARLLNAITLKNKQFGNHSQHDAHEFFLEYVNQLHDAMLPRAKVMFLV